jgi:hypothetical protein
MKRLLGIKILGGVFLFYTLAGFFGVPYMIKNSVPNKVAEATDGGAFSVEAASFNPFTFHLSLQNILFKTPQKSDFVAVDSFSINLNPLDYLWKQKIVIANIDVHSPHIVIHKDAQGEMNFGWLMGEEDTNETKGSTQPLALLIDALTLKGGVVEYNDESEGKKYHQSIDDIGFHLEHIDLKDMSNTHGIARIYASLNDGGFVDLRGKISSMKPFKIAGNVAFDSGKLYTPWKYFKEKLPIEVADGTAKLSCDYELNSEDINATKLSNLQLGINRFRLIDKKSQAQLLTLNAVNVSNVNVWPLRKVANVEALSMEGIDVSASRNPNGVINWVDYVEQINKAFPEDENETKEPWSYTVGSVDVKNVNASWSDDAPLSPYVLRADSMALQVRGVSSDETKPLMATFAVGKTAMTRKSDQMSIASLDGVSVDGIVLERDRRNARIERAHVRAPQIGVTRSKNGKLDIEQYVYQYKVTNAVKSTPWSYAFGEMGLSEGKVKWVDEVPVLAVTIALDDMGVRVQNFTSNPAQKNLFEISSRFNTAGSLDIKGEVTRSTPASRGHFEFKEIDASVFDPYIAPSTYASLKRSTVSLEGEYHYTPKATEVKGKVALSDWVVNDTRDNSVLVAWSTIGATPFTYSYPQNRLLINRLDVDGFYTNTIIGTNKVLNFSTLSKEDNATREKSSAAKEAQPSANGFGIDILKLNIHNGSTDFSDLSLPLPFKTHIHDLNGHIIGISTTTDVTTFVKLDGGVDAYGLAKIGGKLNTKNPKEFTDMKVKFENLELKSYTPYSLEFLGYKIADGKLYLSLGYDIKQGALKGDNKVVIKQIVLGEEKAGGSPWPMRLVVVLLEDSDGVIDIDLPVEGNVNDPEFRYGKVVWQVIGNLLTKAVTSPFRLLGSLMGLSAEDDRLSKVSFEAGKSTILPSEREKLDKLSAVLVKRSKLHLTVHGGWSSDADTRALKIQKLIEAVLGQNKKASEGEALSLTNLESLAEKSIKDDELEALQEKIHTRYPIPQEYTQHYTDALIEKLIELQPISPSELAGLATQRSQAITQYLNQNPALQGRVSAGESQKSGIDKEERVETRLELSVL